MWSTCVVRAYSIRSENAATIARSIGSKPCSRKSAAIAASSSAARTLRLLTMRVELVAGEALAGSLGQALAEPELAGDGGAALARDDVRADLRQPALGGVRIAVVERPRDRELEHAVAEELQPLVRGRPVGRPGGVREDVLEPLARQRVDQPPERGRIAGGAPLLVRET